MLNHYWVLKNSEINEEIVHIKPPKHSNPLKGEQNNKDHYRHISKDQIPANNETVNNVIYRKASKGKSCYQKRN